MLARLRVTAARRMLLHGQRPVAEIAFEVGFESLSAFNENFRKYTAMTPAKYRRLPDETAFDLTLQSHPRLPRP
jgi:AraC family transcriptional regulator of adaptative response / DNA-3-methyladenine glycosylase II